MTVLPSQSSHFTFSDVFSACKGVIWLLLATVAEVPPVVSLAISLHFSFISSRLLIIGTYMPESERYLFTTLCEGC